MFVFVFMSMNFGESKQSDMNCAGTSRENEGLKIKRTNKIHQKFNNI
jgi:hypothetical protein